MNINRDNYENFFLLYVDNELSASERKAVETFVSENTDLQHELELLQGTSLQGETILFGFKNDLYKQEATPNALQEKLLLYMDGELEPGELASLKADLAMDDRAKREWSILQQTRLDERDQVAFDHKKSLYRYETRRVISMRTWRIAAAAALLAAGFFVGISVVSDKGRDTSTAVNDTHVKKAPVADATNPKPVSNTPVKKVPETNVPLMASNPASNDAKQQVAVTVNKPRRDKGETVKKESNHLPKPYFENINNTAGNQIAGSGVTGMNKGILQKKETLNTIVKVSPRSEIADVVVPHAGYASLTETPVSYARNAVMEEVEITPEANYDRILYMDQEKVSRSKISGFLRKVKRVIERKTKVNPGNGIKIAGFEIAVR